MCPLSVSKHEVILDKVSGSAAKSSFLSVYCIFVSPNVILKLWGLAFCHPLGEAKQIPGKTSFYKSTEALDDPRNTSLTLQRMSSQDSTSASHPQPPGSLDTLSPGDNTQEVIQPHKHLMDKNNPEKVNSVLLMRVIQIANCLGKGSSLTCRVWNALNSTNCDRDVCPLPKKD